MPSEVMRVPAVVRLARSAARNTPGQTQVPMSKRAARAIPVGGHTAVALAFRNARVRPSLAAVKYSAARPAIAATVLPTFKIGGRSRTLLRILGHERVKVLLWKASGQFGRTEWPYFRGTQPNLVHGFPAPPGARGAYALSSPRNS